MSYTVGEFLEAFKDYERLDTPILVDGKVYMQVSPTNKHGLVSSNVGRVLWLTSGSNCFVLSNAALYLDEKTYIELDVMLYCGDTPEDSSTKDNVPVLVVDVLSPSSYHKDLSVNPIKYKNLGVCEYWVIGVESEAVFVFNCNNGDNFDSVGFL